MLNLLDTFRSNNDSCQQKIKKTINKIKIITSYCLIHLLMVVSSIYTYKNDLYWNSTNSCLKTHFFLYFCYWIDVLGGGLLCLFYVFIFLLLTSCICLFKKITKNKTKSLLNHPPQKKQMKLLVTDVLW